MCHDKPQKELEEEHDGYLSSSRHLVFARHRKILCPDLSDWTDRIVPEPSKNEEYERTPGKYSWIGEWREHE